MNVLQNKIIRMSLITLGIIGIGAAWYFFSAQKTTKYFTTQKPAKRAINQTILASGQLEVKDVDRIGSLIDGTIRKLYAQENQRVTKGQLIAEIDNGKGDTDVREKRGEFKKAQNNLTYVAAHFQRQKALYDFGQLARNTYEKELQSYHDAQQDVAIKKALYDRAVINYNNIYIKAPNDGIILNLEVKQGQAVAVSSPPTIICEIAKDITVMQAKIEIDESMIGKVTIGNTVSMTFDSYPDTIFTSTITSVNFTTRDLTKHPIMYLATAPVTNTYLLLRPGMTVNAKIVAGNASGAFVVPQDIFSFNRTSIQQIAKIIGYTVQPLEQKINGAQQLNKPRKTLWIVKDKKFIERAVEVGITDATSVQIISGITEADDILVDIEESDEMKKVFQKMFGGGFSS
jgi:HlyD family secretion protein